MLIEQNNLSLDVHVLVSKDTKTEWVDQCLDSINVAINHCDFQINLYVIEGIPGHIGKGREIGYLKGNSKYVTCVDDDDFILPNAFKEIKPYIEKEIPAIFVRQYHLQNGKMIIGKQRHHLCVYRRDVLINHSKYPFMEDVAQISHIIKNYEYYDLNIPLYVHRLYRNSKARTLRNEYMKNLGNENG